MENYQGQLDDCYKVIDRLRSINADLLAACEAAIDEFRDPNRGRSGPAITVGQLRAAIKRAKGEA